MINPNTNLIQGLNGATGSAVQPSTSLSTFRGVMSNLNQRPLKPLAVQQFAGAASRGLELQVRGDTAAVN